MRNYLLLSVLIGAALLCSACGSFDQPKSSAGGADTPAPTVKTATTPSPSADTPPVAVAHGAPPANDSPTQTSGRSGPDTTALDKKVEQAEARAKAPSATLADMQAAAAAYLERGNVFYNAGNPSLYKFALRDFRLALRKDPNNAEAKSKQQQIIDIYNSMGRPVPDLGNEP